MKIAPILAAITFFPSMSAAQTSPETALDRAIRACMVWGETKQRDTLTDDGWVMTDLRESFSDDAELTYGGYTYDNLGNYISLWLEQFTDDSRRCAVSPTRPQNYELTEEQEAALKERIYLPSAEMRPLLSQWAQTVGPELGYVTKDGVTNPNVAPGDVVAALRRCDETGESVIEITERAVLSDDPKNWFVSYRFTGPGSRFFAYPASCD